MKSLIMLLVAINAMAANSKDWKTAVLVDRQTTTPIIYTYTLDIKTSFIVCQQETLMGKPLDISVGSEVQYSRVSQTKLIIKDSKGKEHKLFIDRETAKDSSH